MSKTAIYDYSATPGSNTDIDGLDTQGATGLVKSGDNYTRSVMGHLRAFANDLGAVNTVGGTGDAITVTLSAAPTALVDGYRILLNAPGTNTGAAEITVTPNGGSAFTAKKIRKWSGGTETALSAGDITQNHVLDIVYDSARDSGSGAFMMVTTQTVVDDIATDQLASQTIEDIKWLSKAIGEIIYLPTDLTGVDEPPTDSADYRYIKLTAGLTGSGAYNENCLTSESTSGSAPLVLSTASVSLSGSPMSGQTVRLLNTEGRILRPSTSPGTAQNDQVQGHYHDSYADSATRNLAGGGAYYGIAAGTNSTQMTATGSVIRSPVTDGTNGTPRVGTETRAKNLGVTAYMRIK